MHAQTVSPFGSFACGKISFALRLNCKSAQEEVKWKRSLTYPLRKRKERLKPHERERLKNFFKENPAIELAYEFKEKLCELLNKKSQTAKQCKNNIRKLKGMMKVMKYEAPTEFGKLAETISEWFAPIIRMWRFTKNNGITEGFHRKMKLIQRLAYGYKNFENYRFVLRQRLWNGGKKRGQRERKMFYNARCVNKGSTPKVVE